MGASTLLLYTKTTGHVLAAATVSVSPSTEVNSESVAGKLLPIRYVGNPAAPNFATLRSSVPATELAVISVDAQAVPINQAHANFVNPKDKKLGMLNSSSAVSNVQFSGIGRAALKVSISSATIDKTPGLVRLERATPSVPADPADVQLVPFEIAAAQTTATFPVQTVPPGNYSAFVLVQGLPPYLSAI